MGRPPTGCQSGWSLLWVVGSSLLENCGAAQGAPRVVLLEGGRGSPYRAELMTFCPSHLTHAAEWLTVLPWAVHRQGWRSQGQERDSWLGRKVPEQVAAMWGGSENAGEEDVR